MSGRYPDKPINASDGEAFAKLCIRLHLELMGEDVGYYRTAWQQIHIGESAAGVEFKELRNSHTRLHIEVAERTSLSANWRPSGIFAETNTVRYVCGNEDDIWAFSVADLRTRATSTSKDEFVWYGRDCGLTKNEIEGKEMATIRSMVLEKAEALTFYLYRFQRGSDCYNLERRDKTKAPCFVGHDEEGRFVHYCHCGAWGAFGLGVYLRNGHLGTWYCREHRPDGG